jgi:hypothetical protein
MRVIFSWCAAFTRTGPVKWNCYYILRGKALSHYLIYEKRLIKESRKSNRSRTKCYQFKQDYEKKEYTKLFNSDWVSSTVHFLINWPAVSHFVSLLEADTVSEIYASITTMPPRHDDRDLPSVAVGGSSIRIQVTKQFGKVRSYIFLGMLVLQLVLP